MVRENFSLINIEEMPKAILKKHPQLAQISEALEAYRQGREITACCPKCKQVLTVTEVEVTGTLLVSCANGCTNFRAKRAKKSQADNSSQ